MNIRAVHGTTTAADTWDLLTLKNLDFPGSPLKRAKMAHLLVIDDDAAVRQTMRRMLLDAGHSVVEADDGTTGLAQLTQSPIDIVLTDIFMPGTEGVETIQQIRRLRPSMKIIAMSGSYSSEAYLSAAAKLGAQAILKKPFRTAELRDTINQVLAQPAPNRQS